MLKFPVIILDYFKRGLYIFNLRKKKKQTKKFIFKENFKTFIIDFFNKILINKKWNSFCKSLIFLKKKKQLVVIHWRNFIKFIFYGN